MVVALLGEMRDDGTLHVRDSSYAFKFGSNYSEVRCYDFLSKIPPEVFFSVSYKLLRKENHIEK
jgi:hypothetical protein